jgi:hypothetical protein
VLANHYHADYRQRGAILSRRWDTTRLGLVIYGPENQSRYGTHPPVNFIQQTVDGYLAAVFADTWTLCTSLHSPRRLLYLTLTPQDYIQAWEESTAHIPVSGYARLVSNGQGFSEISWHPTSPGPIPSALVPVQSTDVVEQVSPFEGSMIVTEHQEATPNLPPPASLPQNPSAPPLAHDSVDLGRRLIHLPAPLLRRPDCQPHLSPTTKQGGSLKPG